MSDETSQTQPDDQPPVFPDKAIRHAFPEIGNQKVIQQNWTTWTPVQQRAFLEQVEGSDPGYLVGAVAAFLDSPSGQPTEPQTPPVAGVDSTSVPQVPGTGSSSEQTGGEQPNVGDPLTDDELQEALRTGETAEAYAKDHPERIGELLAEEQRREKPRKTVVEELERAQRVHDRAQDKQGE